MSEARNDITLVVKAQTDPLIDRFMDALDTDLSDGDRDRLGRLVVDLVTVGIQVGHAEAIGGLRDAGIDVNSTMEIHDTSKDDD